MSPDHTTTVIVVVESAEDFRQRIAREPLLVRGVVPAPPGHHVVLLIHGIRTQAAWQTEIKAALEYEGVKEALPLRYGYFDAIRFWCPLWTRRFPTYILHTRIADAMRKHPTARVSAIAHSFGSYALATILSDFQNIPLERVILCGSVLHLHFPWRGLGLSNDVVNDCGTRDVWPVLASQTTWGYGATGTFGFGSPYVQDRFHNHPHSGCLTADFARTFWAPLILDGSYRNGISVSRFPWNVSLLNRLPLRWVIVGALVFGLVKLLTIVSSQ